MATKDTVKRINTELQDAKNYLDYLRIKEPDKYLEEKDVLDEKIRTLRLEQYRIICQEYPKQNPVKYASKKDYMAKKLAFLEAGNLEKDFDYKKLKLQEELDKAEQAAKEKAEADRLAAEAKAEAEKKAAEEAKKAEEPPKDAEPEFKCDKCEFVAKSKAGLTRHSSTHKE